MCLAIPAKVLEVREEGKKALVEQPNVRREVFVALEDLKEGEFVLLQQGFVVERISEKEAKEAWKAWNESRES